MNTSFAAFLNKRGIACASDTDMTLYALSKQEPVAVAVNPYSPIPWDEIINAYLRQGEIAKHEVFGDYARDFAEFLATEHTQPSWKKMSRAERNIIFLGYGSDDVFPTVIDVRVQLNDDGKMTFETMDERCIDHDENSCFCSIGDFSNVEPIMSGVLTESREWLTAKFRSQLELIKKQMADEVTGTQFEEAVLNAIDQYEPDPSEEFVNEMDNMCDSLWECVDMALDSFNIEDLVHVVENFVDAKVQIDHLKNGGKGELRQTKELAVITRTEGLVWIKHSLYGV